VNTPAFSAITDARKALQSSRKDSTTTAPMKSGSRLAVTLAWSTVVAVSPPSLTSTPLRASTPLRSRSTSDFVSGDDGPSLGVIATVAVSLASL
jgi:hypothetical protein